MNKTLLLLVSMVACPLAAATPAGPVDQDLQRIRNAAMESPWAWQQLERLTDGIGPRLSGSPGLQAAVEQLSGTMRAMGAQVALQKVMVPHWVRGREEGQLVEYPGRPQAITQPLHLTALGGSGATPEEGLTAPVLVVRDLDDLRAHGDMARGKIVVFTAHFDQRLAENGRALDAYVKAGATRFDGPALAQKLGATAALVRSIGGADYRLPHTGGTDWAGSSAHIPAAALASEDADLVERLGQKGPVTLRLVLTPHTLPDAESYNVLADWRGRERPDEVVIVSGHLDSWDLGTGAIDDGAGVICAAAVLEVLRSLHLQPRRTIRFIAWTNEENGARGSHTYAASVAKEMAKQFAAIESDSGAGTSLGISAAVPKEALSLFQPVAHALVPIGAAVISRADGEVGSDIGELQQAGVPSFEPLGDTSHYFDYHHTAADTLDKVTPLYLRQRVATMAVLAYYLAEMPENLPRLKITE